MEMAYRRPVAGLLLAAFLFVTAGCGDDADPVSAGATTTATAGPPTSTTGIGDAPTSGASGGSVGDNSAGGAGKGPARCDIGDLKISTATSDAAAGHWGLILLFANTSSSTCHLQGYPGVAGLDGSGKQVTQARRTRSGYMGGDSSASPLRISILPGSTASALVEGTNVPEGNTTKCPSYQGLLVTPPDETHSVHLSASANGCSGLEIHPVVLGSTGRA